MYGPMMDWWGQMWPWMMSMHVAWMLLPLITVVLAVVVIVLVTRGPRAPIAPKT